MRFMTLLAALAMVPASVGAHVTVWPKESNPGAREKYQIRVPNEQTADTIRVEVRFPAGLRVTAFEQKPGWMTEALRDDKGAIIGVRWIGQLPAQQFTEFGVLAANPNAPGTLVWSAIQTYADGTRVEWTGPADSKTPAPRVTLKRPAP